MIFIAFAALLQSTPGLTAPPLIVKPPSDRSVSKPLRAVGDSYELVGHCSRFISRKDMDELMIVATKLPADKPYLMGRMGDGSRTPKSDAWCLARLK